MNLKRTMEEEAAVTLCEAEDLASFSPQFCKSSPYHYVLVIIQAKIDRTEFDIGYV